MVRVEDFIGGFLPNRISAGFRTLDGSDVARWLDWNGYDVIGNWDTGTQGRAVTRCGLSVSTNGYVYRIK